MNKTMWMEALGQFNTIPSTLKYIRESDMSDAYTFPIPQVPEEGLLFGKNHM